MKKPDERGQAVLEVLTIGIVLLIPLIWLLITLSKVHVAALAMTSAAREAALDASLAEDVVTARSGIDRAISDALTSYGLDPKAVEVRASLGGLQRGAPIDVHVSYRVPLLTVPFIGSPGPSLSVSGSHTTAVPRFGDRR